MPFFDVEYFSHGEEMMCKANKYDLALSFWTVSLQYLMLVENASREVAAHGNIWFMIKDAKDGEITLDEYADATRWSDHTLVIPLVFNLYHGIELLVKGFLLAYSNQNIKPQHNIGELCREFALAYPNEKELVAFFGRFTEEQCLPDLLSSFLSDNGLTLETFYQAVRYPCDQKFQTLRKYIELKYSGEDGLLFFNELAQSIKAIRVAAVRLGRSLKPQTQTGQQLPA